MNRQISTKNKIFAVAIFMGVVIFTIIVIQLVGIGVDLLRAKVGLSINGEQQAVSLPEDTPPQQLQGVAHENYKTLVITNATYVPSADVLTNLTTYNNESFKLALNGKFKEAKFVVQGEVKAKGDYFIYLNYGEIGGTLNAARLSANTLDKTLTKLQGGIFNQDTPIDFTVDLLDQTRLASTRKEFEATKQLSKNVSLWDTNILPPTINMFLVAPFNEKGEFGGASITNISFKYICEEGQICEAKVCPGGVLFTKCLKDNFGAEAAKSWCQRSKQQNCSM